MDNRKNRFMLYEQILLAHPECIFGIRNKPTRSPQPNAVPPSMKNGNAKKKKLLNIKIIG